jgi:hypothetical protein
MADLVESIAASLTPVAAGEETVASELPVTIQESYRRFISICDGGYSADEMFHFFGRTGPDQHRLDYWNTLEPWRRHFSFALSEQWWVFAEDVFGHQFCFSLSGRREVIKMLSPWTGTFTLAANDFLGFLQDVVTGDVPDQELAAAFFRSRGVWRPFSHLSHRIPIVLGGEHDLENLELVDSVANLSFYGQLLTQIRHLPAGTVIRDVRIDELSGVLRLLS